MVEEVIQSSAEERKGSAPILTNSKPLKMDEISAENTQRWDVSIGEFSRVLGGGIVPGSIVLVGGDPGIGKSTLLLQVALEFARQRNVLYVSGEESGQQIKMRAYRLLKKPSAEETVQFPQHLYLLMETDLDAILAHAQHIAPQLLIVDSIQTMAMNAFTSSAGSVTQVRECASRLREFAKASGITVFLIGHVTKEGMIAGPRVLEHIVDTVMQLEGDRFQSYRILRTMKNRFGPTSEVGVFEMRETGMVEVSNPSEAFLAERMQNTPGSAVAVAMEGTRPLLIEIQGLTSTTNFGNPRRTSNGVDFNRLLLVIAVLTRRNRLKLYDQDVFVNVVGGFSVDEPAADLAISAAIASSLLDKSVYPDMVLIGEVGLSGELRWVSQMAARLKEAAKMGFTKAIIPKRLRKGESLPSGIEIIEARSLRDAVQSALIQ
ncbi:MAG: DNA repair protein radA [Anaerolinea thermophila]|uniref:DNA repair protein RadA n=1 Tax=Anaerolinea thermophila TaxID=167964 RepID=A0A101FYT6_9CHLR|nr:MAG: DNA repair protein radA [Anaerolinea thermophila]